MISMAACTTTTQKQAEAEIGEAMTVAEKPTSSLTFYMALKNSLVSSDVEAASAAANGLEKELQTENRSGELIEMARAIAANKELEGQRAMFKTLSKELITALKASDLTETVYVQYCPMAFDNDGASWLSLSEDIENPYFGDQMLHCGTVQEEL